MVEDAITLGPDWATTLPHIVRPLADEWLPGLLLRCDYVNGQRAGTTARDYATTRTPTRLRQFILGECIDQPGLAAALALPNAQIAETTFAAALATLYGVPEHALHPELLCHETRLYICPVCLQEGLGIRKHLAWSFDSCPLHNVRLRSFCSGCHEKLRFWRPWNERISDHLRSPDEPFTCWLCGQAWCTLPVIPTDAARREFSQRMWAHDKLLVGAPTSTLLVKALLALRAAHKQVRMQKKSRQARERDMSQLTLLRAPWAVQDLIFQLVSHAITPQQVIDTEVDDEFCSAYTHYRRTVLWTDETIPVQAGTRVHQAMERTWRRQSAKEALKQDGWRAFCEENQDGAPPGMSAQA